MLKEEKLILGPGVSLRSLSWVLEKDRNLARKIKNFLYSIQHLVTIFFSFNLSFLLLRQSTFLTAHVGVEYRNF